MISRLLSKVMNKSTPKSNPDQGAKPSSVPRWPGVLLALLTVVVLMSTMGIGFTRDEGYYFKAGELYSHWFEELVTQPKQAFTKASIDQHFAYNPEHPALPKMLFGISWRVFGRFQNPDDTAVHRWYHGGKPPRPILGIMKESTAFRFPAVLMAALLVYLVYRMGALAYRPRVGVFAAVATMLMPRFFWNSHLACFDLPVATMWFFTIYLFWRGLSRPGIWMAIATAAVWGLALSTKHNAYFIPGVLVLWWLPQALSGLALRRQTGKGLMLKLPPVPFILIAMLLVAPIVLYLTWPKLWFDPIGHWVWYFRRHFFHEFYWAYYFGHLYANPPFPVLWPWVMTAVTVPLVTFLLAFVGLVSRAGSHLRRKWPLGFGHTDPRPQSVTQTVQIGPGHVPGTERLLLLNLLIPIAIFSSTKTPIFGGTKHMMPAMPYLALFAAVGFEVLLAKLWPQIQALGKVLSSWRLEGFVRKMGAVPQWALGSALAMLMLSPALVGLVRSHPDGPCYYNELLGGFRGMGNYGMQREFWGNSGGNVLDWVNENAPPNAFVNFHDTNYDSYLMYLRDGMLRRDIRYTGNIERSQIAIYHHHAEFMDIEQNIWKAYGTSVPVHGSYLDGVPIISVYQRPEEKVGVDGVQSPARLKTTAPKAVRLGGPVVDEKEGQALESSQEKTEKSKRNLRIGPVEGEGVDGSSKRRGGGGAEKALKESYLKRYGHMMKGRPAGQKMEDLLKGRKLTEEDSL